MLLFIKMNIRSRKEYNKWKNYMKKFYAKRFISRQILLRIYRLKVNLAQNYCIRYIDSMIESNDNF